jgi:geranylgeranyl reductase family protein
MTYDVIVVGAGPAGSTAAATLAQGGRHVLLIDRVAFPRDKTCGDAIQAEAVELLRSIGYREPLDPQKFTSVVDWTIEAPSRVVVAAKLNTHGHDPYIARRVDFDSLVYQQAIANGAEFCQAQVVGPICEGSRVVGVTAKPQGSKTEIELRAPIVIAADGATSAVARVLTDAHQETLHRAVAIRCYATLRENHNHRCEFYFPKSVLPGYGWIFPIGERQANIGVGMRLDKYRKIGASLETLLERFLDMLGSRVDRASIAAVKSWQLPFGSKRYRRSFDGCLLVGDAGGFVDPLLGAGIYFGMKTGQIAAQVADAALRESDTSQQRLSDFDRLWKRSLGWSLLRATLVQRIVIGQPWMLNAVCAVAALHPVLGRYVIKTLSGEKI